MNINRRSFLTNLGVISLLPQVGFTILQPPQKVRVLLNAGPSGPVAPFYLAKEKGYFAEAGIEVEFVGGSGAAAVVPRIVPDGFDFGYGDLNALIELAGTDAANAPIGVYAAFNTTPLTIAVAADGPIKTPKDLEGQTIGGHPVDAALRAFPAFAQRAEIDTKNIKYARSDESMLTLVEEMLAGKTVGVFGFVNTITAACTPTIDVKNKLRFIEYRDFTPEFYGNTLMVSPKLMKQNPTLVKAFVRAFNLGLRDTIADVDAAMDAVEKNSKTLRKEIEKVRLMGTIRKEMGNMEGKTLGLGNVSPLRLEQSIALITNTYPLPKKPKASQIFTDKFLPPVAERITTNATISQKVKFLLNSATTGAQAWFHVANHKKYFADAGLEIEFTPGVGAYTAAPRVIPENFDMAYGDINSLIEVAAANQPNQAPIAVFAMFNASPSTIVVAADGDIKQAKDLEGKKIIGHATDVALKTFPAYAKLTGIDTNKTTISTAESGMGTLLKSVLSGENNAMFGYVSTITAAAQSAGIDLSKIRFIKFAEVLQDFYGSAVMVNPIFMKNHPEIVRKTVEAISRGLIDTVNSPEESIKIVMKQSPENNETVELNRLKNTLQAEMSHPEGKRIGIGDVDSERLRRSIELLVSSKNLGRVPSVDEVFSRKFLPPISQRVRGL